MEINLGYVIGILFIIGIFVYNFYMNKKFKTSERLQETKEILEQITNGLEFAEDVIKFFKLDKQLEIEHTIDDINKVLEKSIKFIGENKDKNEDDVLYEAFKLSINEAQVLGIDISDDREELILKIIKAIIKTNNKN